MTALNKPTIGSVGWGTDVNNNWTSIENALASGNGFRLTSVSGTPVPTSNQTTVSTLYLTPFVGDAIGIYDTSGSRWSFYNSSEVSLALSGLTSGKNYDVFVYYNAGLVLELSAAWTNDTTRADAITQLNGIWVKNSNNSRRLVGTIRTTGTTSTTDTETQRFLSNTNNLIARPMKRVETTTSWTYSTATWRYYNNSSANRLEVVIPIQGQMAYIFALGLMLGNASAGSVGIGFDSSSANSSLINVESGGSASSDAPSVASLSHIPTIGFHYYSMMEYVRTGTLTLYGNGLNAQSANSGISGHVFI